MTVKKSFKMAAGMILAVSFSNGFAMNTECPSASEIRNTGSKFLYAYNISKESNSWALLSEPFSLDEVNWQTIFTVELPYYIDNPNDAIRVGEALFAKSPLLAQAGASTTSAGKTECLYTTADVNYKVTAVSPPPFGVRKIN